MRFQLAALFAVAAFAQPRVTISEPVRVVEAPAEVRKWGYYQFPTLDRVPGGISVTFHVHPDSAKSYGLTADVPNRGISRDEGKTWTLTAGEEAASGVTLPNGDRLRIVTPRSVPLAGLTLPAPVGVRHSSYGSTEYQLYRMGELPKEFQGVPLARMKKGASQWITERAVLDDPAALRYSVEGVFPVVWWGDMKVAPDKSLLAVVYPGFMAGEGQRFGHVFCYRSTDQGRTWHVRGRIPYQPDESADPKAQARDGFGEPAFDVLDDGSLLCVLRTTDGNGSGPMYASRSRDLGKTWSAPKVLAPNGVMPRLLKLASGVLVLSSGRPGADLRFSFDGRGEAWSAPNALVPLTSTGLQVDSCGYTSLLALGPDSFLVAYSWFLSPGADGKPHKSIQVRRVTVSR